MIELSGVSTGMMADCDLALGPGLHAIVGTEEDGLLAVAPLVAGILRPRRGKVRVAKLDPYGDPQLRARIGATFSTPSLPARHLVVELLAARRGSIPEGDPRHELFGAIDVERTADDRVLELLIALTTPDAVALALTEPFAVAPFTAHGALARSLALFEESGATVLVLTRSSADAWKAGGRARWLVRGRLVDLQGAEGMGGVLPGRGVELRVEAEPARALLAALAGDPAFSSLDFESTPAGDAVRVRGTDLGVAALAIARAAVSVGARVRSIVPIAPSFDELKASASGNALGAYHGAYRAAYDAAYRAAWRPPPPSGEEPRS
jgi:ABC-2 type transport system ATP-binding protein